MRKCSVYKREKKKKTNARERKKPTPDAYNSLLKSIL